MNDQEAFDGVYAWLAREGATKCVNANGDCVYWRADGNRCAIGGIMPEDMAKEFQHAYSSGIAQLILDYTNVEQFFSGVSDDLLDALQTAHDSVADDGDWQDRALSRCRAIAHNMELDVPAGR